MANTTSAQKAVRQIARRTAVNKSRRTKVRSTLRVVEEAIDSGDQTAAKAALAIAEPTMMKAVSKGVYHKNTAARKISRLSGRVKALAKK
ncbi:MAG: 30S ribosomal protein S20 [Robiginitomaculum sp.]|nr:30S ribosomal protein S20 [Robiginitomaculum sp.]